jgi:hypothetical protein
LLCACGHYDEAIAALTLAQEKEEAAAPVRNAALLARTHHMARRPDEARKWLAAARELLANDDAPTRGRQAAQWAESLETELLLREVEAMLARGLRQPRRQG